MLLYQRIQEHFLFVSVMRSVGWAYKMKPDESALPPSVAGVFTGHLNCESVAGVLTGHLNPVMLHRIEDGYQEPRFY